MFEQMTPEEIQAIHKAYNDALLEGKPITQDMAAAMKDASVGIRGYTQAMEVSLKKLGRSTADFTKTMYEGKLGMEAMNSAVDAVGSAVNLLINILPVGRLVKLGLMGLNWAVGTVTKTINKQSDQLYKSWQDLSRVGASTAGGMREVFDSMQQFGYGLNELDSMIALVKDNSTALATFGGTVASGSKAFANVASEIQHGPLGKSLQSLALTPDQINRGVVGFVKQQQLAGVTSTNIQKDLTARSVEYIKQLDLMTRLTGESNEALEANRAQAMANNAFNQTIYELEKKGDQASIDKAKELRAVSDLLIKDPVFQKDFWGAVGGDISVAGKMMNMGMVDAVKYLQDPAFKSAKFMDLAAAGIERWNKSGAASLYKIAGATDDYVYSAQTRNLFESKFADRSAQQNEDRAKLEQELQQKALEPTTKAMLELRLEQMKLRDSFQSLTNGIVDYTVPAMDSLAKSARAVGGTLSGKGPKAGGGAGTMGGAPAAPTPAAPAPPGARLPGDTSGLKIKGSEFNNGGPVSPNLIALAHQIQEKLAGDLNMFTAGNDLYHQGMNSSHNRGRALDFTITDPAKAAMIADMVRGIPGVSLVKDEYNNPSGAANGPHIHAEVAAKYGGMFTGPLNGYRATLHGTEAVIPMPNGKSVPVDIQGFNSNFADQTLLLTEQVSKLDELLRAMRDQVNVSTKILQRSS